MSLAKSPNVILNAEQIFGRLQGLLCLYKERGTLIDGMKKNFAEKMAEDINAKEQRPIRQMIKINEDNVGTELDVVTMVPDLADHPLVVGPRFVPEDFSDSFRPLNPLGPQSSGVQLFGFGAFGQQLVDRLWAAKPVQVYHVTGKLGIATEDFLESGALVERAKYDHVTETRLDRVIQAWQATHRDLMFRETGIDYSSQAAFETASRGFVRPKADFRSAVFVSVDLVKFRPPYFTVEVHATNGACEDLSELIHHLGIACRTRAAAARIHRLRAGPVTLKDALLFTEWNCDNCLDNVEINSRLVDEMERKLVQSGGLTYEEVAEEAVVVTQRTAHKRIER